MTIRRRSFCSVSLLEVDRNCAINPGKTRMLTAKISGIIPAELTLSGMNVVLPPYMRPDRTRFAW